MRGYGRCPRCGSLSLEHLQTHSYCWECNYSPDLDRSRHLKTKGDDLDTAEKFIELNDEDDETDDQSELNANLEDNHEL